MTDQDLDIFSELANASRLEILYMLDKTPTKISQMAKKMNASIQATQRHTDRLTSAGLIERNSDGAMRITAVGQAALQQIPAFLFLAKHKKYFQDHTFSGIPRHLMQRLGELNNCEFIEDSMQGWKIAKDNVATATKFFYGMTTVIPIEFYPIAKKSIRDGVHFKILYSEDTTVAKGFSEAREENGWINALKNGRVEERYVKHIPLTNAVTEKTGQLLFANKKTDQTDGGSMFYSKEQGFRNWCLELFDYYWENVEKIKMPALHEI